MRFRMLLLAGTILPFVLSHPGIAAENPATRVLAQTEQAEQACPEGTAECPPVEPTDEVVPEQPAEEAPVEVPAPEQPAQDQPAEQAAPEQPAQDQPAEQAAPEQPAQDQPAEQAAPEQPADEPLQTEQPEPAEEQPTETTEQQQPAEEDATVAEEDATVEEQLEAQGDEEEADSVRNLRQQLLDQLMQAVVPGAEEPDRDRDRRRGDRRDRDRDRADRDGRDRHRWDRDRFYDRRDDRRDVVEERGGRIIIDLGNGNLHVEDRVPDEGGRLLYGAENVEVQELPGGRTRTIVYRRNGVEIITVRNRYGEIVRRAKRLPDGREIVLFDNRFEDDDDIYHPPLRVDVRAPRVDIPQERYIVDLGQASQEDIRGALLAPPVEVIEQGYTLDEVLYNEQIRAYSPRIDLDTITFDFGSATIGTDQMPALLSLGEVLEDVLRENPDEVYLIEGHTDLVGTNYDNLILSDRRAEAVAVALSQNFDIPPENLVTEGYGEQYPKVMTEEPERRNRRATVRRLTELLQAQN